MAKFAVIFNDIVGNVIEADTKEIAEQATGQTCVEYTEENPAIVGLGFDGITFEQPATE